jgi:hypothetical protein
MKRFIAIIHTAALFAAWSFGSYFISKDEKLFGVYGFIGIANYFIFGFLIYIRIYDKSKVESEKSKEVRTVIYATIFLCAGIPILHYREMDDNYRWKAFLFDHHCHPDGTTIEEYTAQDGNPDFYEETNYKCKYYYDKDYFSINRHTFLHIY